MSKKQKDVYTTQEILQMAIDILQTIKDNPQLCEELYLKKIDLVPTADDCKETSKTKNIISEYLFKFGIPTNYIGYDQLRSVILFRLRNPKRNISMDKCYRQVAEFYNCNRTSIYRNIRTVLDKAFESINEKNQGIWEEIFGNCIARKEKVSNTEFITRAVEDIRVMLN